MKCSLNEPEVKELDRKWSLKLELAGEVPRKLQLDSGSDEVLSRLKLATES
jgi:hypothetical protein